MKKITISLIILFSYFTSLAQEKCNNHTLAVAWFNQSAEMTAAYIQAYNLAKLQLLNNLFNSQSDLPKAVVLDIDETVLDNSPFEVYLIQNNLSYSHDLWDKWVNMKSAKPLPGALEFTLFAKNNKVEVFYISNRSVKNLQPTMENLQKLGFPYADPDHILLKSTTSDKTERRNEVAKNYDIILLIGDNLRDFDEKYKDRSTNYGKKTVYDTKSLFGKKYIILPNPMYGQWQKNFNLNKEKIILKN